MQRMLLVELNEFNAALLRAAVAGGRFPHLARVLAWRETRITTEDSYDSGRLEPWVQWVSVHTGAPSPQHGIRNLGDVPSLNLPQLWEVLDAHGVSTGIWGVMNGARRGAARCRFFVPDPWTFSEEAHPPELAALIDLPRYLARNYLNVSAGRVLGSLGRFAAAVGRHAGWGALLGSLGLLARGLLRFGSKHFVLIAWFEYLSGLAFLAHWRRERPHFAAVFLNTLAHVQHHYWTRGPERVTLQIAYALAWVDRWLGHVLAAVGDTPIVLMNGLSQTNTNAEPAWILYRQRDPRAFLESVGLAPASVAPLMTHDAHVRFATRAARDAALRALDAATVEGRRLFHVEVDATDPCTLFYRLDFTDALPDGARARVNGHEFRFLDRFAAIVTRTGKHVPSGSAFSRGIGLPADMPNHAMFGHIIRCCAPDAALEAVASISRSERGA
jgi:hypothetical protein